MRSNNKSNIIHSNLKKYLAMNLTELNDFWILKLIDEKYLIKQDNGEISYISGLEELILKFPCFPKQLSDSMKLH